MAEFDIMRFKEELHAAISEIPNSIRLIENDYRTLNEDNQGLVNYKGLSLSKTYNFMKIFRVLDAEYRVVKKKSYYSVISLLHSVYDDLLSLWNVLVSSINELRGIPDILGHVPVIDGMIQAHSTISNALTRMRRMLLDAGVPNVKEIPYMDRQNPRPHLEMFSEQWVNEMSQDPNPMVRERFQRIRQSMAQAEEPDTVHTSLPIHRNVIPHNGRTILRPASLSRIMSRRSAPMPRSRFGKSRSRKSRGSKKRGITVRTSSGSQFR
jgi:hypothetical protein